MRVAGKTLAVLLTIAAILYVFDYAAAKIPIPGSRQVYADVTIDQYYAVKEKGNSIEYMPANSFVERCVYSVFPHFGYHPCWYVMRHARRAIEIGRTLLGNRPQNGAWIADFAPAIASLHRGPRSALCGLANTRTGRR